MPHYKKQWLKKCWKPKYLLNQSLSMTILGNISTHDYTTMKKPKNYWENVKLKKIGTFSSLTSWHTIKFLIRSLAIENFAVYFIYA